MEITTNKTTIYKLQLHQTFTCLPLWASSTICFFSACFELFISVTCLLRIILHRGNSTLPNELVFSSSMIFSPKRISSGNIFRDEISKIIKSLDQNKAHGLNGVSISMLLQYQSPCSYFLNIV